VLFFRNIENYRSSTNSIKLNFFKELSKNKAEARYNYNPSLLIDFDNQIFYSNYPESIFFEEYIPDNWTGYRYWEEKGTNYLIRKD
jgi:hypothetical protein